VSEEGLGLEVAEGSSWKSSSASASFFTLFRTRRKAIILNQISKIKEREEENGTEDKKQRSPKRRYEEGPGETNLSLKFPFNPPSGPRVRVTSPSGSLKRKKTFHTHLEIDRNNHWGTFSRLHRLRRQRDCSRLREGCCYVATATWALPLHCPLLPSSFSSFLCFPLPFSVSFSSHPPARFT
jgi:hypothetical protein